MELPCSRGAGEACNLGVSKPRLRCFGTHALLGRLVQLPQSCRQLVVIWWPEGPAERSWGYDTSHPNAGREGYIPAKLLVEAVSATEVARLILKDVIAIQVLIVPGL